jgi:3-oxoacyl-[acyl-carrier protein] reductase
MALDLQMAPPSGTRALVVGGCGGIGSALVQACVHLGHRLVVLDLPQSIERSPPPDGVRSIGIDVMRTSDIDLAFAEADRELGGIDVLVNLVGFMNRRTRIEDLSSDEWSTMIRGNLESFAAVCRCVIPIMQRTNGGAIVNVSSGMGVRPLAESSAYSVAKAGVIALTKAVALECAPQIRANAIAPGVVQTAFLTGGTGRGPAGGPTASQPNLDAYTKTVPMKRIADAADIVGPILFLASPAAGFINGQTLHVNGGSLMP